MIRLGWLPPAFCILAFSVLALSGLGLAAPALAGKPVVTEMYDVFGVEPRPPHTPAVSETTIRHQVYFTTLEDSTSGWAAVNFRAGQPNAWHRVTGTQSCVGQAWWCGDSTLAFGPGYDNNWVQTLKTNVPIDLAGSSGNVLTFKHRLQSEEGFDWAWVLLHDASSASTWDTLGAYSGDLGSSCVNASLNIPNSWTTRPQPLQLMFLFGSDLTVSRSDSNDVYTGWSIDDVKITASGSVVKFFDDNEGSDSSWVASSPDPGPLWHIENYPGTSLPTTCYFLSTKVWVPFEGNGFGVVPDFADAMLTTPAIDITGTFRTGNSVLRLQFDNWLNLPRSYGVYWSLWIQGSADTVTWTPWRNALDPIVFYGETPQCVEGSFVQFDPYFTTRTGIQPGTPYIRLGFRIRDEKQTTIRDNEGQIEWLGVRTEGTYFDNIGLYYIYTISGVEAVSPLPTAAHAEVKKIYPNPFNPQTTIEFSVPKSGPASLRIFDLQGKRVATLVDEAITAGVYRVRWNGKTDDGRDLSSGVYFARVESAKSRDSARLMMIK